MSAFDFIANSQINNNQTSNKNSFPYSEKNKRGVAAQRTGQASNSLFHEAGSEDQLNNYNSRSGSNSSLNKEADSWSSNIPKSDFKSSFSFISQNNGTRSSSHVTKHQPLKFSSSFIMEDFINDDDEISYQSKDKADKNMKKENINKYFSLMEDYPAAFTDKRRGVSSKGKGKLFQSMSNDISPSRQNERQSPMIKSAFDFMNFTPPALNSNTTSPSLMDEIETPIMSKSIIKPDKEVKLLQASTRWQKIQKKKSEQVQSIQRTYENQIKYQKMVHEIKEKIELMEYKKQQALQSEDFEAAHKHAIRKDKMEKDLVDFSSRNFEEQARKDWQNLIIILQQESQDAESMAKCCQEVKEERQHRLATFSADKKRLHDQIIKQTEQQRAAIESEKSEIAFDLGMWTQNHADLDERMEEAVQEEVDRKKTLETTSATIQLNIEELRQKLKQLEAEQATVNKELQAVDIVIDGKLAVFNEEVDEYNNEKKTIEARQEEIQHKLTLLDEQDAKIEKDMENQQATMQLNEQELNQLVTQIEQATERAQNSKEEQNILENLLNSMIESRDQTVAQHVAAIRRSRESITRKNLEIKSIQDKLYQCEQACIDLEEETAKVTSKLKSLDKLKSLAIENGQFEKAGALSMKIKAAQSLLLKLEESKDPNEEIALVNNQLKVAKDELNVLEQELVLMENNQKTELGLVLNKRKQQLHLKLQDESLKNYDTLITVAKYELQSIDSQLSDIQSA